MEVVKVLKRKDASSLVVAVVLALIVQQAVADWASRPADWFSGVASAGGGWQLGFWRPLVTLIIQVLIFELLFRVYVWLATTQRGRK